MRDIMTFQEINTELQNVVAKATLPQAIRLCIQYLRHLYPRADVDALYRKIRFKANPSLAFQKSELSSATLQQNNEGSYIELTLNFLAIFGSASPLPSHYCEMVLESADSDHVLQDFLDMFNHNIQKFIYPIWVKHRYYIQYQHNLQDPFSKYILSILGLYDEHEHRTSTLNLRKLMPYIGILNMRQKSSGTLLAILRHYLVHEDMEIRQCITDTVVIPEWQYTKLGGENCFLGKDMLIGESMKTNSTKFRIILNGVSWNELIAYGVDGTKMDELNDLISFMLDEPLKYDVALRIPKKEICCCTLSDTGSGYLGVNSVIGIAQKNLEVIFAS
ncbi:type VI secretion system baseplate subunit TssG [uncultured Sulfuricurvum sp.]|uniref:type VI secretion system baseplate subunit TssG n=1 Tax=uncultured Sulfuricurvum sp. TaxID=430693 RepID=UPI002638145A|nr:type VI secretion system baseplate subunit TssG [uncultured Sulfuricurvum sp.]